MKHFSVMVVAALLAMVACTNEPEISIDRTDLQMDYKGGRCEFNVSSNCEWEIICDSDNEDLLTISQTEGPSGEQTIQVIVNENKSTSILNHYFTAVAHGKKRNALAYFTITQGAPAYVIFSKNVYTADYIGGEYEFTVSSNFPWSISVKGEGITVEPMSGTPKTKADGDDEEEEEDENASKITVTIDEYEGDVNRKFELTVTAIGDDTVVSDQLVITQNRPMLVIGKREYPIKKMGDGRWWMVQNLCYSQKGVTIGDGSCGIWYPCSDTALDFDSSEAGIIAKGLLYSDATAFDANITATTARRMENTPQGICPDGWHIPKLKEYLALVGKSTDPNVEVNTDAPYYDAARGRGSLSMLEEAGFNTTLSGYVMGRSKGFEANGDIQGYLSSWGYITTSYLFCSTAYSGTMWYALVLNRTANTAEVAMMSNFTTSRPFAGSVRCIKDE